MSICPEPHLAGQLISFANILVIDDLARNINVSRHCPPRISTLILISSLVAEDPPIYL